MNKSYQLLDRSTRTAVLFASLLIAFCITGTLSSAFGKTGPHVDVVTSIQEIVVQG